MSRRGGGPRCSTGTGRWRPWLAAVFGVLGPAWHADADAPAATLILAVDADDSDGSGLADHLQTEHVPGHDLRSLPTALLSGARSIEVKGDAVRLVRDGRPLGRSVALGRGARVKPPRLQGVRVGTARVVIDAKAEMRVVHVEVVRLSALDGDNAVLEANDPLTVSLSVTNDGSLPTVSGFHTVSGDRRDLRLELQAAPLQGLSAKVRLDSYSREGQLRDSILLTLQREDPRGPLRSPFVRLVSDGVDRSAPGVAGRVLQVALRDRVQASYRHPDGTVLQQEWSVYRPGRAGETGGALEARLRVFVLRTHAGGPPVIGRDELSALAIVHAQVEAANEIWLQCGIGFGRGTEAEVNLVAPPPPSLISVADGDGLPAAGGGVIRLRVDNVDIPPIPTVASASPVDTALAMAAGIERMGFHTRVTLNPRTQFGAGPSADVQVRSSGGQLTRITASGAEPLSSDRRQRVQLGIVDIGDGISEFNNMTARSGTLEERALIKAFADDDPGTIELFVINRFTNGSRQGEAFIEAGGGSVINAVVVDRNGLQQQRTAWTVAHEVGHVLLDAPLHPDNLGPDRPWRLMDSDSNRGTVYGPKRLGVDECMRARHESAAPARPVLLRPAR